STVGLPVTFELPGSAFTARMERGCPSSIACCTMLVCRSAPEPTCFSPTWMGCIVRGAPRKAANSESDNTRYLPAFTEEIAYITPKNASSRVSRSAYGIAHASWFVCSSCLCLREGRCVSVCFFTIAEAPLQQAACGGRPPSVQVALQLRFDGARVLSLRDRQH